MLFDWDFFFIRQTNDLGTAVQKKRMVCSLQVCSLVFGLREGHSWMISSFSKNFDHIKALHRGLLTGYDNDRENTACFEKFLSRV